LSLCAMSMCCITEYYFTHIQCCTVIMTVSVSRSGGYGGLALSSDEPSAEQIVSRFAEDAGLSLADVVSNYTQYADAIQQSFTAQHRKSVSFLYIPQFYTSVKEVVFYLVCLSVCL